MSTRPEPSSSPPAVTPAAPSSDALIGKRVHKYEVVRVIGRGGMGTVYEALNTAIGKRVAMKFIDADTVQNADAVARFQREAQAASAVESAHIVDIFDSGMSEAGQPYIVMELLRGEDLGHRIKRCGRLELGEAVHVTAQLLRGLHRAHKAGIVHRDLKPDNVFLVDRDDDPNFAKILDFGISKVRRRGETPVNTLTRQGTVLGTPFYMSPEQAQAQPDVDARSDLWSVGAILYECLTGRPPYTGTTYEQVIVNICMNDAEDVRTFNPSVPEGVAHVLTRALARDRDDRFGDAREFLDALRAASGSLISSRGGSLAEDFNGTSSSDPGRTPSPTSTPSGRRRAREADDPALDATVKFRSTPPPRERHAAGSSAARRRAVRARQRRMMALVAVSALLLGGLSAFVIARAMARPVPRADPSAATAQQDRTPAADTAPAAASQAREPQAMGPVAEPVTTGGDPPASSASADTPDAKTKTAKTARPVAPPPAPPVSPKASAKPADSAPPAMTGVAPGLRIRTN
jgi:serine/threonine-protein kinase